MSEFDNIVNSILNESEHPLPVLDGIPEIYACSVNPFKSAYKSIIRAEDLVFRLSGSWDIQFHISSWKADGGIITCTTTNFSEALQALKDLYKSKSNFKRNNHATEPRELSHEAIQTITSEFGYLIGTWRVIDATANSHALFLCVDVNTNAYLGAYKAIEDDIRDF